jgi:hypothetical protein
VLPVLQRNPGIRQVLILDGPSFLGQSQTSSPT